MTQAPTTRSAKRVTLCVLTYGDHAPLARRCIDSILKLCDRSSYQLIVGANQVCAETENYIRDLERQGSIDRLEISPTNINKNPMMRRMFEAIDSDYIWWLDDDSYVLEESALPRRIKAADKAKPTTVMWGYVCYSDHGWEFTHLKDPEAFVRTAPWYRGLPPPSWRPGGKGEFNFEGRGTGDGQWLFIPGGDFFIRTSAIKAIDWPDARLVKNGDDVFLGEAVRQQGWTMNDIDPLGVMLGDSPRRGDIGLGYTD